MEGRCGISKKVIGFGLAIVGLALIATGIGAPLGTIALGAGLGSISVASVIGMSLMIGANFLLGPAVPKMPGSQANGARDRLFASLDVSTPRKILFGNTAGATDVRYQTYTGDDQEWVEQIICVASHEVESIYELWLDNELAWSAAGGVQGDFAGYLTATSREEGTSGNGIAIDGTWTASCTLTGCSYIHAKFLLVSADTETNESPFASGVTNRLTIRCKGALVYDPRLDSTVTGGAGSHRAGTQSTWAWDDDASRNPALQLLWFMLGWKINGKLAVGMGLPAARIDLPSFITAANACDESVTKNGGGTEPRYRSDGVLTESDDRTAVVEALCATMNAVMRDSGGKLSIYVLHNDLSPPVASFDENDIIGAMEWAQTPDLSATYNIVRGQRTDPSDEALYQPTDYPEIKLTSPDGIDRIQTVNYPLVQSNGQVQRLAKQFLQRNQYQGRLSFTGKPKWWQVGVGDVIDLSHVAFGWADKKFRVAGQKIARTGETETVLVEEHADIYAWDNNEAPPVNAGAPTIYDPRNGPMVRGIGEARAQRAGNMLSDVLFQRRWTLSAGIVRQRKNDDAGYAKGDERFHIEISPSASDVREALSEPVAVNPGQQYYFKAKAQRGTSLGSGSRLNFGGQWLAADKSTVVSAAVEGDQQTPTILVAGELPKEVSWSDTAPATARYFQMRLYTPARAGSSGTFRIESPWVSLGDASGVPNIGYGPASHIVKYAADGTVEDGELPAALGYILYLGGVAQTVGVNWKYKVVSGTVNGFTNSSGLKNMSGSGTGTFTLTSLGTDTATIEITATKHGSTAKMTVMLAKSFATATGTTGGGGSSGDEPAQTDGFFSFSNTSFGVITDTLTYTVPTGKTSIVTTVNLGARPATGADGAWTVEMKVQRNIGGTWTDQGATLTGTSDATTNPDGGTFQFRNPAEIAGTRNSTGLSAGTQYEIRVVARIASGTRAHTVTGSVSVASP